MRLLGASLGVLSWVLTSVCSNGSGQDEVVTLQAHTQEIPQVFGLGMEDGWEASVQQAAVGSLQNATGDIPDIYDSRTPMPNDLCSHVWRKIQFQGLCKSSWAISAAMALDMKLCVKSKGIFSGYHAHISAKHICECEKFTDEKKVLSVGCCGGGSPQKAFEFWAKNGAPTASCVPYTPFPTSCTQACTNPFYKRNIIADTFYENNLKGSRLLGFSADSLKIAKAEVVRTGAAVMIIQVFDEFFQYKRGIYAPEQSDKNRYVGEQSVTMMGWGVLKEKPYLLAANSWGNNWGEEGFFKITSEKMEYKKNQFLIQAFVEVSGEIQVVQEAGKAGYPYPLPLGPGFTPTPRPTPAPTPGPYRTEKPEITTPMPTPFPHLLGWTADFLTDLVNYIGLTLKPMRGFNLGEMITNIRNGAK